MAAAPSSGVAASGDPGAPPRTGESEPEDVVLGWVPADPLAPEPGSKEEADELVKAMGVLAARISASDDMLRANTFYAYMQVAAIKEMVKAVPELAAEVDALFEVASDTSDPRAFLDAAYQFTLKYGRTEDILLLQEVRVEWNLICDEVAGELRMFLGEARRVERLANEIRFPTPPLSPAECVSEIWRCAGVIAGLEGIESLGARMSLMFQFATLGLYPAIARNTLASVTHGQFRGAAKRAEPAHRDVAPLTDDQYGALIRVYDQFRPAGGISHEAHVVLYLVARVLASDAAAKAPAGQASGPVPPAEPELARCYLAAITKHLRDMPDDERLVLTGLCRTCGITPIEYVGVGIEEIATRIGPNNNGDESTDLGSGIVAGVVGAMGEIVINSAWEALWWLGIILVSSGVGKVTGSTRAERGVRTVLRVILGVVHLAASIYFGLAVTGLLGGQTYTHVRRQSSVPAVTEAVRASEAVTRSGGFEPTDEVHLEAARAILANNVLPSNFSEGMSGLKLNSNCTVETRIDKITLKKAQGYFDKDEVRHVNNAYIKCGELDVRYNRQSFLGLVNNVVGTTVLGLKATTSPERLVYHHLAILILGFGASVAGKCVRNLVGWYQYSLLETPGSSTARATEYDWGYAISEWTGTAVAALDTRLIARTEVIVGDTDGSINDDVRYAADIHQAMGIARESGADMLCVPQRNLAVEANLLKNGGAIDKEIVKRAISAAISENGVTGYRRLLALCARAGDGMANERRRLFASLLLNRMVIQMSLRPEDALGYDVRFSNARRTESDFAHGLFVRADTADERQSLRTGFNEAIDALERDLSEASRLAAVRPTFTPRITDSGASSQTAADLAASWFVPIVPIVLAPVAGVLALQGAYSSTKLGTTAYGWLGNTASVLELFGNSSMTVAAGTAAALTIAVGSEILLYTLHSPANLLATARTTDIYGDKIARTAPSALMRSLRLGAGLALFASLLPTGPWQSVGLALQAANLALSLPRAASGVLEAVSLFVPDRYASRFAPDFEPVRDTLPWTTYDVGTITPGFYSPLRRLMRGNAPDAAIAALDMFGESGNYMLPSGVRVELTVFAASNDTVQPEGLHLLNRHVAAAGLMALDEPDDVEVQGFVNDLIHSMRAEGELSRFKVYASSGYDDLLAYALENRMCVGSGATKLLRNFPDALDTRPAEPRRWWSFASAPSNVITPTKLIKMIREKTDRAQLLAPERSAVVTRGTFYTAVDACVRNYLRLGVLEGTSNSIAGLFDRMGNWATDAGLRAEVARVAGTDVPAIQEDMA